MVELAEVLFSLTLISLQFNDENFVKACADGFQVTLLSELMLNIAYVDG